MMNLFATVAPIPPVALDFGPVEILEQGIHTSSGFNESSELSVPIESISAIARPVIILDPDPRDLDIEFDLDRADPTWSNPFRRMPENMNLGPPPGIPVPSLLPQDICEVCLQAVGNNAQEHQYPVMMSCCHQHMDLGCLSNTL